MLTPFSLKNRINKARSGSPGLGGAIFLRFEVNARGSTLKDCENNFGSPGEDWLSFCFLHPSGAVRGFHVSVIFLGFWVGV